MAGPSNKRKAEELTTQIVDEVTAAAAAGEPEEFDDEGSKDDGSKDDGSKASKGTRRFFPRVKHLLTADYEPVSTVES
jgi:hypothetical protein